MTRKQWNRLKAKAEAGESEAQWQVGSWLQDGLEDSRGIVFIHPDLRAAALWFRRSAHAGNPSGQTHFGCALVPDVACAATTRKLFFGSGVRCFKVTNSPRIISRAFTRTGGNNRRALLWYRRAVAGRDGDALVEAGRRYYAGVGVRRNPGQAVRYFHRAVKSTNITQAGREDAMFHLGRAFHEGRGVKQSNARALNWLSQANKERWPRGSAQSDGKIYGQSYLDFNLRHVTKCGV